MEWQGVMKVKVVTISPYDSVRRGYELMTEYNIRHLLVMDSGELEGVVSERDIFKIAMCDENGILSFPHRRIGDVLVSDIKTCSLESTTTEICQLMIRNKIDCVPIVNGDKVHGLVTSMDLIRLLAQYDNVLEHNSHPFDFHVYDS